MLRCCLHRPSRAELTNKVEADAVTELTYSTGNVVFTQPCRVGEDSPQLAVQKRMDSLFGNRQGD
jgi:DNA-directed RNA polymerase